MPRLNSARIAFENRIGEAEDFIARSSVARHPAANRSALLSSHIEWVHEVALLKVVVSLEQLLETTLGLYVVGERTLSGFRPRRKRYVRMTLPSILDVFRGDQNFVGWNVPDIVIRRAEKWLRNGEPFQTPMSAASQLLSYLQTMRNAIAHDSDSAKEKHDRATRKLYGALPRRHSPGALLMAPPPASLPHLIGPSLFAASVGTYRALAAGIVP